MAHDRATNTTPTESNVAYALYRDGEKVASVSDSTNYLDASGTESSKYSVSLVVQGVECARSIDAGVWAQNYITIPLTPPATGANGGTYNANDGSVGDLDGDGQLDIVLKWIHRTRRTTRNPGSPTTSSSTATRSLANACSASISARTSARARTTAGVRLRFRRGR